MTEASIAPVALAIHGGAGKLLRSRLSPASDAALREVVQRVLASSLRRLEAGASSLDVVCGVVAALEDAPEFNAGRGSALTALGTVEMDAAVMDGAARAAGAVAALEGVRNPVLVARRLLDEGAHVLLAGAGARRFADERGFELASESWLVTPERRAELESAQAGGRVSLDRDEPGATGTVGAVARDARGRLASAGSTGGMTNQLPGRVGDTPIVGAGIWADDASCAVAATGHGEAFLRSAFAHEVDAALRLGGLSLERACDHALARVAALGSSGGCIALARQGPPVLRFNTAGMVRGWAVPGRALQVAIYGDEP